MLILDIVNTNVEPYYNDIVTELESNNVIEIKSQPIYRGDAYTHINGYTYINPEYDTSVTGNIIKLEQTETGKLIATSTTAVNVIYPTETNIKDTNITKFKFKPKGEINMINEKVVGTTFRFAEQGNPHYSQFQGENVDGEQIPTRIGQAVLVPEPDNQFDPNAVAVVTKMVDGSTFHLGYVPKGSELQKRVNAPTLAKLIITAYSEGGDYNDAFNVEVDV